MAAQITEGTLICVEYQQLPLTKKVPVQVTQNGMIVVVNVPVTEMVEIPVRSEYPLRALKQATDATGKPINNDKLAGLLKELTPVVVCQEPMSAKYRALFTDKVIYLEFLPRPQPIINEPGAPPPPKNQDSPLPPINQPGGFEPRKN